MAEVQFSEYFLHFVEEFNDYEKNMLLEYARHTVRNFILFLVTAEDHSLIGKNHMDQSLHPFKNYEVLARKKPYECYGNIKHNVLKDMFDSFHSLEG